MRQQEEETRQTKAVSLKAQGKRWENIRSKKLTWNEMWKKETKKLKFAIASVYDVLPSPSNLAIWKLTDDPPVDTAAGKQRWSIY